MICLINNFLKSSDSCDKWISEYTKKQIVINSITYLCLFSSTRMLMLLSMSYFIIVVS